MVGNLISQILQALKVLILCRFLPILVVTQQQGIQDVHQFLIVGYLQPREILLLKLLALPVHWQKQIHARFLHVQVVLVSKKFFRQIIMQEVEQSRLTLMQNIVLVNFQPIWMMHQHITSKLNMISIWLLESHLIKLYQFKQLNLLVILQVSRHQELNLIAF